MSKPVTPQDLFDMWQKMVNPGAYPLQSLMFPAMDPKEIERKIAELEAVEHWLRANLSMLQLSIKSMQYQRAMLKGGEKFREQMKRPPQGEEAGAEEEAEAPPENPALWAWKMMAEATKPPAPAPAKKTKARKKKLKFGQ